MAPAQLPKVFSASPNTCTASGGCTIILTGSFFTGTTGIHFGAVPATSFSVLSDGQISVVVPPHSSGSTDITVTNSNGSGTLAAGFTYLPTTPETGPGDGGGPGKVIKVVAGPAINPSRFSIQLAGAADGVSIRIYSKALVCLRQLDIPVSASGPGWVRAPLGDGDLAGLAKGLYFAAASSQRGGVRNSARAIAPFLVTK